MKFANGSTEDRRSLLRRLALLAAFPLALSACTDTDVENAGAQNAAAEGGATAADSAAPRAAGPAVPSKFGATAAASTQCMKTLQDRITTAAAAEKADSAAKRPPAGHSAVFAAENGWYPKMPPFAEGSILPCGRIVAYYGHPKSTRMGALGEFPKEEMLRRFKSQVQAWETADPSTPVIPALHMVSVVAQGEAGTSGKYRTITGDSVVERMYSWAKEAGAIFIVDIQVGQDDIRNILPRFDWILKNPDVHIAVDPEFYMRNGVLPGRKIGTMYASDINYVSEHMAKLVKEHNIPPKVFIVHRFTRPMVQGYKEIQLRPEVQLVMHMDGWGAPWLKFDSFRDYVVDEPVQFVGWKNFYHNDTKKGDPLVSPQQMLKLHPAPLYIQYQ